MSRTALLQIYQLIASLEAEAHRRRISKADIARGAGLHVNTLAAFDHRGLRDRRRKPRWNPSMRTLAAVERFLMPPVLHERESQLPGITKGCGHAHG